MILVFLFATQASAEIAIPCIAAPGSGIECPPGSQTSTRWIEDTPTLTDQLQDPGKFTFFVIPIALIIILSFLIYFKNKEEKALNIERVKLSLWNQLIFLIIGITGFGIYIIISNNIFNDDYYGKYETIKNISLFTYPIACILLAHYITLFLRERVHYIIGIIILVITIIIGYFTLTGF